MIYITGDTHRIFWDIVEFCERWSTSKDDVIIILGDVGINYYGNPNDYELKQELSEYPITLFCIYGNHEIRPENISTYRQTEAFGATAYIEPEFPSLIFAKDGEIYDFDGNKCIVIGGANSIDKHMRTPGISWWEDEQPSDEIKKYVEDRLDAENWTVDIVLSHICPYKYMPRESFMNISNSDSIDNSTEQWLDTIEQRLDYSLWYCGHFHTEKYIDRMRFMFHSIDEFGERYWERFYD